METVPVLAFATARSSTPSSSKSAVATQFAVPPRAYDTAGRNDTRRHLAEESWARRFVSLKASANTTMKQYAGFIDRSFGYLRHCGLREFGRWAADTAGMRNSCWRDTARPDRSADRKGCHGG